MKFWIATGGTGGHIFPALAVADELIKRGHRVAVSTDARGRKYIARRNDRARVVVWASGVGARNPVRQLWSMFKIFVSAAALTLRFAFSRPDKIVAFGGYASVAPLIAGRVWRIPTFLHEQNAVIGRANRFALRFVKTLMTAFPIGAGVHVGLPVRKEFAAIDAKRDTPDIKRETRLLITGGSLGAKVLDEVVPQAIMRLAGNGSGSRPPALRNLFVIHQTRPENVEKLREAYAAIGVKNNVLSFIKDMAGELVAASLVISRAGASTVVEMQTVGVPAILVPLGINPDQLANANAFAAFGGGIVIEQRDFNADDLARRLSKLLSDPQKLERMAELARAPNNAVNNILDVIGG